MGSSTALHTRRYRAFLARLLQARREAGLTQVEVAKRLRGVPGTKVIVTIARAGWPEPLEKYLAEDEFELVIQVNGKLRARVSAPKAAGKSELEELARGAASQHLEGKEIRRAVVVPGRLVNFVVA